ncbi:hypothetical protein [Fibrella arboris]|uniref:hypothetical protein n=1 Tax=Fibrella arboris TaxID=3242486 RepID=UPI003521D870
MLSVKDAAKSALSFYKDIYPDIDGELVEEVELDEQKAHWLITLSFPVENNQGLSGLAASFAPKTIRQYKIFKIDAQSGEVESMRIRQLKNDVN